MAIIIDGVQAYNNGGDAVHIGAGANVVIRNLTARNNGGYAVWLDPTAQADISGVVAHGNRKGGIHVASVIDELRSLGPAFSNFGPEHIDALRKRCARAESPRALRRAFNTWIAQATASAAGGASVEVLRILIPLLPSLAVLLRS